MNKELTPAESALWAGMATASSVLGWRGVLTLCWIAAMVFDYLLGSFAALKSGNWSSQTAREGLWHKAGMIAVVIAAILLDFLLVTAQNAGIVNFPFVYKAVFMPVVMAGYIITEIGSMIENAALLGAHIPGWLRKAVKIAGEAAERAGNALSGPDSQQYISDPDWNKTGDTSDSERRDADSAEDGT